MLESQKATTSSAVFSQMISHLELKPASFARHIDTDQSLVSRTLSGQTEPSVTNFYQYVHRANFRITDHDRITATPNPQVQYLSMMFAFNVAPKSLTKTTGDWHQFSYFSDLNGLKFVAIGDNPLGAWGIDNEVKIPTYGDNKTRSYKVANHIRALLDLIYFGHFSKAREALVDFIGTDEYDRTIFRKVSLLKASSWEEIDDLMDDHFTTKWRKYKRDHKPKG